jgi:hypothetical protein
MEEKVWALTAMTANPSEKSEPEKLHHIVNLFDGV